MIASVISLILSTYGLTVSHYTVVSSKLTAPVRVVSLSDIQGHVFGKENGWLVDAVRKETPDLILIIGDMIEKDHRDTSDAEALVRALAEIAPVYFSYGNHELEYEDLFPEETELAERFTAAGATVLEKEYKDITVNGQEVRIGGIYGYCMPEIYTRGPRVNSWYKQDTAFLLDFQDTERFTLLLCHMPFSFLALGSLEAWKMDAVLAGHTQGGQVRFPFLGLFSKYTFGKEELKFPYTGGLYAPDQEFFPGRLSGVYLSKDGTRSMVLSRGLGGSNHVPRFNNIPEVVVVDYLPE